jgi:glycosyltransferase involved in cell wall biosynthesis
MSYPLVSVIIPVYNAEKYIEQTILSVLSQTFAHMEIIVVNDHSTDNTAAILNNYRAKIKVIDQPNQGAATARNNGYRHSHGTYIKFLDADDLINPEMVAQQVALAQQYPDAVISSKWGRFYNNDISSFKLNPEECWRDMPALDWLFSSWENTTSTTVPGIFMIPRQIVERAGLWDERLSLLDDAEYFARTILTAEKVIFSPDSTLYYRSGLQGNLSSREGPEAYLSAFAAYDAVVNALLTRRNDHATQKLAANIWQLFIYKVFPNSPDLTRKAEKFLTGLPKADIIFPAGGYTDFLCRIFGWKFTKRLKLLLAK